MERYFDIYLNAGNSVPVVINANQYDASETWIFTLYTDDNQQYVPQNGSIVGLKSDGKTIANAGTVNGDGQVVIAETEQMTACAGINIFELILNGNHGTANFVVLVEPRPGDNATPSDSDLSLMQEAIEAASTVGTVGTLADKVTNLESQMEVWLTEHAGMSNETILWEGRLTGTGSVELSEDASQFDTIAVYTQATSYFEAGTASEAHYYKASDLIANHAVVSVAVASTVSSTAIQSAIITGVVGISGTQNKTFNLIDRKGLYWTGTATDDAGIILGSSDSALITKVVGIRNEQTDAEVVAARVGSDGTQYNNLKARLDAENSDLKSAISDLEEQIGSGGSGMSYEFKTALDALVRQIGYLGNDPTGREYVNALHDAMFPPADLVSISAVYTQTSTVYTSTSLESLRSDLVVTARYSDNTTAPVTTYTLSGTLSEGTSTVTVAYGGKTTTFTVTVTSAPDYVLPSEYQEVEWIGKDSEYSGTDYQGPYIQTNITAESKEALAGYSIDFIAEIGNAYTANPATVIATSAKAGCYLGAKQNIVSFGGTASENAFSSNVVGTDKHTYHMYWTSTAGFAETEGETATRALTSTGTDAQRLCIGNGSVSLAYTNYFKFYGAIIVKYNNSLVARFVPCYRKADSVIGFYETEGASFYTNAGSSDSKVQFVKGSDI